MSALPKDSSAPLAEPKQAVAEVLAGRPGPTARRWLGPTALVVLILFAIDTYLVVQNDVLPFDFPIAIFIQQLNWGPVVYPMELINASAGIWQVLIGAVAIIALFIFERRAGWLMLIGSISSLLDNIIKLIISRQRPPADLVHILSPTTAAMVIVLTCIARVWAGAHWPSDVIGGVLLGIGWSAFVLWLPERWLPSPTFTWFRGTLRSPS
ncbi:MAG: phosphatase PAP2 family protein [Chloroflexi bacterium]|nr:MAG: phosphatase PAP2 family protein [Chloroflexota bacterium]